MKKNKHEIYFDKTDYLKILNQYEYSEDSSYTEEQLLLVAKAYFIQELYAECIALLKTISHHGKAKVLYEKQTLFFKASYLLDPQNTDQLKAIIEEFEYAQRFINDKPFSSYHHNVFKELRSFLQSQKVISSSLLQQIPESEQQINQRKEEGDSIFQMEKKLSKVPRVEGFPCFLLQKNWRKLQVNYYENKKNVKKMKNKDEKIIYVTQEPVNPGPITNFTIVNHIFEVIPYENKSSSFLNIILFPGDEYQVVSKSHWQYLCQTYGGIPVRRTFQIIPLTRFFNQITYHEKMTLKLLISHLNNVQILQVSSTALWPYNVIPMLCKRYGLGQLKEEYSEKNFKLVGEGKVFQPQSQKPLKFITFQNQNVYNHTTDDIRFQNKMFQRFDFEKYSIEHSLSNGLVGLTNDKFLCFMNSTLQCLSNTYELSKFFLQNSYIQYLNFSKNNDIGSRGQITCAYADIIKRLWSFNCQQRDREIDPHVFKEVFAKRFENFVDDSQQDAHEFLNFLLNCLHDDLNIHFKVGPNKILKSIKDSSNFDEVRKTFTENYETNNQSEITQLFKGYTFSTLKCLNCEAKYYNFDMHLIFPLPVPATNPSISVYFISPLQRNNDPIRYNIFLENIKSVEDIIKKVQQKQNVLSPTRSTKYKIKEKKEFFMLGLNKKSLKVQYYFDSQTHVQKLINNQGKFFYILYSVSKENEKNTNSHEKIIEIEIDASEQPSETDSKKLTLIQYFFGDERKSYPKLIYLEKNTSDEVIMQIVSEFIPDQALKYSGGVATEKEKLECIQKIKLQKVKEKPYEFILKVKLVKNLSMFHEKEKVESIGELSQTSQVTLENCFNIFQEKDKIQEEEGWICGKCRQVSACEKSEKIYSVGSHLIIVLKRFKEGEKICTKIEYPIQNLDISKYIDESFKLANPNAKFNYDLYGVIIHRGSLNRGHYYSYCKNQQTKKWYLFDDQLVRQEINPDIIVNQNAYVLFYRIRES